MHLFCRLGNLDYLLTGVSKFVTTESSKHKEVNQAFNISFAFCISFLFDFEYWAMVRSEGIWIYGISVGYLLFNIVH